jgi:hypothetical protein
MATFVPPKRATAFKFSLSLFARSDNQIKITPTLAAGDVKVSKDFGATANISTLPSEAPASSGILTVDLSGTEMTADIVTVIFRDAAGAEWNDVAVHIATTARQVDDLAFPTTSGRAIDVSAGGEVGLDWANIGSPTTAVNLSGTNIDVDQIVASVSGAVGSVTGAVGSVTGAVGSVTGAVGSVGAGGITASSFAANAITAAKLDPDVTTELQAGLATSAAVATLQTSVDDLPTNAELTTALGTADDAVLAQIALVKAQTDLLPSDPADASVIAGRFDTLDTSIADLPTNAELATALGTADDAVLAQIALVKAKTDSLTFTVAGEIDANIQSVNDVTVTGTGAVGDEWGP